MEKKRERNEREREREKERERERERERKKLFYCRRPHSKNEEEGQNHSRIF